MSKNRQVVLTEGPILKALIALALPIMATSFLNTFYSITDMAWIGMLGSRAVAGVGVGGMYVWLSQGLSALAKMGGQVNVAQALGRGRRDEAGQYACSAVQLTVIFAVIFAAVCTLFTDELIALFHVGDAETVRYAVVYTRITCGLVIFFLSDVRAYGDLYGTGRFEDTARGEFSGTFCKCSIGSAVDTGGWSISKTGSSRCGDRNGIGTVYCNDGVGTWCDQRRQEKCIVRMLSVSPFGKEILSGDLSDWCAYGTSKYCILCDFHGTHPYGGRFWPGGGGCPEGRGTGRSIVLEYGRWIRGVDQCIFCAELRGREDGQNP